MSERAFDYSCWFTQLDYGANNSVKVSTHLNLIVGPNNSGKTQLLRDLLTFSYGRENEADFGDTKVLRGYQSTYSMSQASVIEWYEANAIRIEHTNYYDHDTHEYISTRAFNFINASLYERAIQDAFQEKKLFRGMERLSMMLTAKDRLALTSHVKASSLDGYPETQMERFALTDGAIDRLSILTREVFDQDVDLWTTGDGYQLVLGKVPISRDNWSAYQKAASDLPLVDAQGDGVRSFIGILISLLSSTVPILLIDEPEAFLHPPQARKLGKIIADLSRDRQVFIATHSAEIVEGILDTYGDIDLAIHRITRHHQTAKIDTIDAESVIGMGNDPLVRHANLIDGLFADATVICEADRDAAYYEAVWNYLFKSSSIKIDVHFTHALGGKARIEKAVETLAGSGLPVVSILDLDFLSEQSLVERLITAHGGLVSEEFWQQYAVAKAAVEVLGAPPRREWIVAGLREIQESREQFLSDAEVGHIRDLIRNRSGWTITKKSGISALEGDDLVAMEYVISELKQYGVFVVAIGELESFHPKVSRKDKGKWIVEALSSELYISEPQSQDLLNQLHVYLRSNRD